MSTSSVSHYSYSVDESSLLAHLVLVDGDGILVLQKGFGSRSHVAQIIRHDERRRHDGP